MNPSDSSLHVTPAVSALEALSRVMARSEDPGNPAPDEIRRILERTRTVAVVGMSRDPRKPARRVPSYLAAQGYDVLPVNPFADRILGKEALDSLDDVEEAVDMVLVFRPSREAGDVVRSAADRPEEPVIWLQEGILHEVAAREARDRGLTVVQDLCIYKAHRALRMDRTSSG